MKPERVADVFHRQAREFPSNTLFEFPETLRVSYGLSHKALTYDQVSIEVARLSDAYRDCGLGNGDRVALLLENRPVFFHHFLAINGLGASIVPIHHELTAEEIGYRLSHSEARFLICLPEHRDLANDAAAASDNPPDVVLNGEELPTLTRSGRHENFSGEAAILYTSGSTGMPKGCVLSNEYFMRMGEWYINQGGLCELRTGKERLITPLPLSHMNALACSFMAMLMSGGCLIQLDRFHPRQWWRQVRETGATALHYLGVMPAILLNLPESADDRVGDQVRFGLGSGVDPKHHAVFERRFGFPLLEGWAMTETGGGACIIANAEPRHVGTRCFGKPKGDLETRVVDQAGNDVPTGEPGELWVRAAGPDRRRGFFSQYLKDARATAEAWDGGWFHTGDIVRTGGDGQLHFVDRQKNIIRRSGENIAALEVETALLQDGRVAGCAVAPVYDELRGEEVAALILLDEQVAADEATAIDIADTCRAATAYFKAPGYLAFVGELPVTSSEKLRRGELKPLCQRLLDNGDMFDLRERKRRPEKAKNP